LEARYRSWSLGISFLQSTHFAHFMFTFLSWFLFRLDYVFFEFAFFCHLVVPALSAERIVGLVLFLRNLLSANRAEEFLLIHFSFLTDHSTLALFSLAFQFLFSFFSYCTHKTYFILFRYEMDIEVITWRPSENTIWNLFKFISMAP